MDPEIVSRLAAVATAVIGAGVILGPFVSYGVNVAKRVIGRASLRRIVLPLLALLLGWTVAGLFLILLRLALSLETVALVLMVGFVAAKASDEANAKAVESKRRDGGGRG